MEVAVAGVAIPFTPAAEGWNSVAGLIQAGQYDQIGVTLTKGFLGMDAQGLHIGELINPFDFNNGRYTKMLIAAGLVSKIRKKFVNIPMGKIPLIGKYIS